MTDSRYHIQSDDQFGALPLIDIDAEAAAPESWFNQTLTTVDESVIGVGVIDGDFHWHKHDDTDEFFLVLDGQLLGDIADSETITLERTRDSRCPRGRASAELSHGRVDSLVPHFRRPLAEPTEGRRRRFYYVTGLDAPGPPLHTTTGRPSGAAN